MHTEVEMLVHRSRSYWLWRRDVRWHNEHRESWSTSTRNKKV